MTITATSLNLSWAAPGVGGAVSAYTVFYRVTGSGAFSILADPVVGTSYSVTGLAPGTSYDFAVSARNGAGPGILSVITQATLGAVPNAPGGFAAVAGSPAYSSAALSWTAPATDSTHGPALTYTVSYRLNNTGAWTVAQTGIAGLSATIGSLSHNSLYGFLVDAVNGAGTNVAGSAATLTTGIAAPNVPAISSVAPVADGTVTNLTVTWAASAIDSTHDAATSYNLRYRTTSGPGSWTTVSSVTSPYVITGLSSGTSYDVEVQAANASTGSPSAWSAITAASTYATVMAWVQTGPAPWSHTVTGQPVNATCTPNPGLGSTGGVNFMWSTSATVNNDCAPAFDRQSRGTGSASGDNGYPVASNKWGCYLTPPTTAGSYYIWAVTTIGDGAITWPVTVT